MITCDKIKSFIRENHDKEIAFFVDMDGTIVSLEVDKNNDIVLDTPGFFLNKRPLKIVIGILENVSESKNVTLYILSACKTVRQAEEKRQWLKEHVPFIKEDRQIYVIKEVSKYSRKTKAYIKTLNIKRVMEEENYDLAIYLDDEYLMLKEAYDSLGEKVWCLHISDFIE